MMEQDAEGESVVLIHGEYWRVADIGDQIADCAGVLWEQKQWHSEPALVKPNGVISQYTGQPYDTSEASLVSDAWDHAHCEICFWKLYKTDDLEHGIGYTDGRNWVCTECYRQFLAPEDTHPAG